MISDALVFMKLMIANYCFVKQPLLEFLILGTYKLFFNFLIVIKRFFSKIN